MKKEEVKVKELENPFAQFSVLKGEFANEPTSTTTIDNDDEITTGDETIIDDDKDAEAVKLEAERIAKGDAELAKTIAKQEKALARKKALEEGNTEDEEDEEDPSKNGTNSNPTKDSAIREFVQGLSEKGIIDFDDKDEEFTDDEDGIETLLTKTVNNRIDKWAKTLPQDFSKLLEFVENGGSPKQFLDVYYGNHSWETFKVESEEAQKLAVTESLRLAGDSPEDIQEMVTEWADNGSLEKRAKSALVKLQKNETIQKEELTKIQKEHADKQRQSANEYWDTFKKDLYSKEDIKGFKLTPKVKDNLWSFMTQIDKKTGKTPYQLATETDKEASLLFALQAMNKFDISKLEKQVESKVANKYAGILKNYSKSSKEKISSGTTDTNYDTNPFAGFKNGKA